MRTFWKLTGLSGAVLLITGCVTYPYETAFAVCDAEAGACYDHCEQFADAPDEYQACHAECEVGANQCFAGAHDQYRYAQTSYGYRSYGPAPWYGRYGYWYPDQGYIFSFSYHGGRRYRSPYYRHRPYYGHRGRRRHRGDGGSGAAGGSPPAQSSPPPASQPPPASPPPSRTESGPRSRENPAPIE